MKKLVILSISMLFTLVAQALDFTVGNLKYSNTDNDNYIVDTAMFNVISKFAITEEMENLFNAEPFNEARMFSMAPDPYPNYPSFFAPKLAQVENTSSVVSVVTNKVLPKDSVHYFQFRFPREYFNTQKYKFTLIYAMKKNAPSFRLSLRSVNMQKDTTHIQYLYPLKKDGVTRLNSVPVSITNADSIRRLAAEINFGTDYTELLDVPTKDKSGNTLKPVSYTFYSVTFEPFQIFDYTEEVWLRFELGSVLVPMNSAKTMTSGGKYIFINNFFFEKVEDVYDVTLQKAGTLLTAIGMKNLQNVSKLTISGPMNSSDVLTIRTMLPYLQILDMKNAEIVSGGVAYNGSSFTADNQIGEGMFSNMPLKSITLPSGVTSIGDYAFSGCSGLSSITIPSGVTSIGDYAFLGCSGLSSIAVPSGVTSIGDYAFSGCSGLSSITIPSGVTSIGRSAFSGCSGLSSITIPSGVTSIGDYAFSGCSGLSSITIPSGITSIGSSAFSGCGGLRDITCQGTIPASVGTSCFYGVDQSLCFLIVPKSAVTSYSSATGWRNFNNIGLAIEVNLQGPGTLLAAIGTDNLKNLFRLIITGPINGTDIFIIRTKLPKLQILDMENATIVSGGVAYYTENGSLFTDNNQIGDRMFCNMPLKSVIIPSAVTSIGEFSFSSCTSLTSITIPSGVNAIGEGAFSGCSSLASITIPSSLTLIGDRAFSYCSDLTTITLPSGVSSIGEYTFFGCYGLTSITLPSGVTSIGVEAFSGCSGLTSITLPSSVTSIGSSAFSECSGLTSITLPSGVTSIGEGAFAGCSSLTSITIPSSLTLIGNRVFSYCSDLTSITIPSGVTSIGSSAFSECSGLTSITLPSGVTSIGSSAFSECSGLTSITLPSSVTSIGDHAFYNCSGLASITLPFGVNSIGVEAFSGCSSLKEIHTLNPTPLTIDSYVFSNVDKGSCILYVPQGNLFDYFLAIGWRDFEKIVEESVAGEDLIKQIATLKVYTTNDAIVIEGAEYGDQITICTESGALVKRFKAEDDVIRVTVPQNAVYLIQTASQTVKVVL